MLQSLTWAYYVVAFVWPHVADKAFNFHSLLSFLLETWKIWDIDFVSYFTYFSFGVFTIKHNPKWRFLFQKVNEEGRVPFIPLFYTCWSLFFLNICFSSADEKSWGSQKAPEAYPSSLMKKDLIKKEQLILRKNLSFSKIQTFSCVIREFSCDFVAWCAKRILHWKFETCSFLEYKSVNMVFQAKKILSYRFFEHWRIICLGS